MSPAGRDRPGAGVADALARWRPGPTAAALP